MRETFKAVLDHAGDRPSRGMQIRFSNNSLLAWSDPDDGVQTFSEKIADDVSVVATFPHPESSPEVSSPPITTIFLYLRALYPLVRGGSAGSRCRNAEGRTQSHVLIQYEQRHNFFSIPAIASLYSLF